jgi:hypothetical protein
MDAPSQSMRCQYKIQAGKAGTGLTPPTGFKNSQGTLNAAEPTLAAPWFYVYAKCDESPSGGTNSEYYQSSVDRKLQVVNEGGG